MEYSDKRLREIFDYVPGTVVMYIFKDRVIKPFLYTDDVPAFSGLTEQEYLDRYGEDAETAIMSEDYELLHEKLAHIIESHDQLKYTCRIYHKTKGYMWTHIDLKWIGTYRGGDVLLASFIDMSDTFVTNTPGGIFIYSGNEDEEFLYISQNMLDMLGYTRTEFVEKFENRFSYMVYEQDRERVLEEIDSQIEKDGDYDTCEYRIEKKDGSFIWVHDEGHYVVDENGNAWFYVIDTDITNAVAEKEKISERKTELEQIINNIPSGVGAYRKDNGVVRCIAANPSFADLIGISPDDLIGKSFDEFTSTVHPDDIAGLRYNSITRLDLYKKTDFTYRRFNSSTGRYVWLHLDGRLVRQPDGSELAYFSYTDVNSLKDTEQELRYRKDIYDLAIQGAHLFVWEYDIKRRRAKIDDQNAIDFCRRLFGTAGPVVDNIPACIQDRTMTGEDREELIHMYDEIFSGSQNVTADIWFGGTESREPVCIRISHYTVFDAEGRPETAYGLAQDVTVHKKEELRYKRSLEKIVHANPNALGYFRLNLTKNLCGGGQSKYPFVLALQKSGTADGFFAEVAKYIADEHIRSEYEAYYNRENLLREFRSGKDSFETGYPTGTSQGGKFWVTAFFMLLQNPATQDIEAITYTVNDTERKKDEKTVQLVINNKFDYIGLIDPAADTFEFRTVNLRITGLPVRRKTDYSVCIDYDIAHYVTENDAELFRSNSAIANIQRELAVSPAYSFSYMHREDGKIFRKQLDYCYLDEDRTEIMVTQTDITAAYEHEQEQLMKMSEALASANRANKAKSQFLSRMSHDMRTPLNGIIGMTYLTKKMDLPEEAMQNLANIDSSSKFLLGLINDVLDMSKAESGRVELHPEPYRPEHFYEYLSSVIIPLCEEENQKFVLDAKPLKDHIPLMDKLRINQIFFNLFSNAVKYTPEGGTITYYLREHLDSDGKIVMNAEVRDNGIGMSEEFQKTLFEPFTQENRDDTSKQRGTGLGLAIVRQLLDTMGGTIAVKSEAGKGTVFFIEAKFDSISADELVDEQVRKAPADYKSILAGKHVLLCEDHPLNIEIGRTLLEDAGMIVNVAEDGQLGLDAFLQAREGFYDVVIMDIRMPVMDGYEAARKIRSLCRSDAGTVPIIAMTADAFNDDVEKCFEAGMNGHIAKPIDPEVMYKTIAEMIILSAKSDNTI